MDPNTALDEIRKLVKSIQAAADRNLKPNVDSVDQLTELVSGLDNWLSRGGFPPKDWNSA